MGGGNELRTGIELLLRAHIGEHRRAWSPTRRESCATVISVGEGMAASTSNEDMDAMFQPRPHGAIAVGP